MHWLKQKPKLCISRRSSKRRHQCAVIMQLFFYIFLFKIRYSATSQKLVKYEIRNLIPRLYTLILKKPHTTQTCIFIRLTSQAIGLATVKLKTAILLQNVASACRPWFLSRICRPVRQRSALNLQTTFLRQNITQESLYPQNMLLVAFLTKDRTNNHWVWIFPCKFQC